MDSKRPSISSSNSASNSPGQPSKKMKPGDGDALEDAAGKTGQPGAARSLAFDQHHADVMVTKPDDIAPPRWFVQFFVGFEQRLNVKITKRLDEVCEKVKEHDESLTACSIQMDNLEKQVQDLKKERSELIGKLDDLENRSRRNNLVFHGISETEGPKEQCQQVIQEMLTQFVGLSVNDFEIERCHRTPSSPPPTTENERRSPRIVHVAFSTYSAKEKVRKACIARFKADLYRGKKIFVSDDFSSRVLRMRKEKMEKFKQMKDEKKKPFFLYPDRLAYRGSDGKLHIVL